MDALVNGNPGVPVSIHADIRIFHGIFLSIRNDTALALEVVHALEYNEFLSRHEICDVAAFATHIVPDVHQRWQTLLGEGISPGLGLVLQKTQMYFIQSHAPPDGVNGAAGVGQGGEVAVQGKLPGKTIGSNMMKSTFTLDGIEVESEDKNRLIGYVSEHEHLYRCYSAERKRVLLTKFLVFTPALLLVKLNQFVKEADDDIPVHNEWTSVRTLELMLDLRVLVDDKKWERFIMFQWDASNPYLLSLGDFHPETTYLDVSHTTPTPKARKYIIDALRNLAAMFALSLGGEESSYFEAMKPMIIWLTEGHTRMAPDCYVCYRIHLALERLFRRFREERAVSADDIHSLVIVGAFEREMLAEFTRVRERMPGKDQHSGVVTQFMESTLGSINFGGKRGGTEKSLNREDDKERNSSGKKKSQAERRSDREMRNKTVGATTSTTPVKDENHISKKAKMDSVGKGVGNSSSEPCPFHLACLLGVKYPSGSGVIVCNHKDKPTCPRGVHVKELRECTSACASEAFRAGMKGTLLELCKSALETAIVEGKFKA